MPTRKKKTQIKQTSWRTTLLGAVFATLTLVGNGSVPTNNDIQKIAAGAAAVVGLLAFHEAKDKKAPTSDE